MKLSIGAVIAQRYEIVEKLGSGGMSIVYRALDRKLNRSVTFKVMREEFCMDENFIGKFNIEARATASISHLNLVNVYDVGNEGQIYYIVMEYIDGLTLKDLIKRKAPFSNEEILGVAIQIAAALQHAHKNDIVHRDVKPQNILITRDFTVKVTDFGIAQSSSSDSTKVATDSNMGSVHYFSPEQARGGYVDFKSDIYSLGIVMYEMATGELPFDSDAPVSIALMHINETIPDIKSKNSNISDSVIKIILKATEKISIKRYQDIGEMLDIMKRTLTKLDEVKEDNIDEIEDEEEKYHTIKFSEEDITAIRREARQVFFADDDYDDRRRKKGKGKGKKKKVYQNIDEIDEDELENEELEDDYDDDDDEYYDSYDEAYELYSRKENNYKERYQKKSKDEVKVILAAILTSFIIVLSVLAFVYFQIKPEEAEPVVEAEYIIVPQFIGNNIDDANVAAEALGLTIVIASEVYSDKPKGEILEQSFEQGREIQSGQKIDVAVSIGMITEEVPDVRNILFSEAYEILVEHFVPEIIHEYNSDTPVQIVFHQDPEPGEELEPGETVMIYVSRGVADESVIVPDVLSETEGKAILALQEIGLIVRTINRISSSTVEEGFVISQSIEGGSEVQKGEFIDINISVGPAIDDSVEIDETDEIFEDVEETGETDIDEEYSDETTSSSGKNIITLPMDYTYVPEGIDPIKIRVSKYTTESGSSSVVYEEEIPRADFPVNVDIEGEGQAIIILSVYFDGSFREQGRQTVNFDTVQTITQ